MATRATTRTPASGPSSPVAYYQQLATKGALADRYFQSVAGQSTSNDMYLWTTRFEFVDNAYDAEAVGTQCSTTPAKKQYDDVTDPTANRNLGKTLSDAGVSWTWYGEGYTAARDAGTGCPTAPTECPIAPVHAPPCVYDPADMPSQFFKSSVDSLARMRDYTKLASDLAANRLPSVVFVKAIGYKTEHPGLGQQITPGVEFVRQTIDAIEHSKAAKHTLILLTYDEGGGYYDHVAPPPTSTVDNQPYGPRIPMIAIGPFARAGAVSRDAARALVDRAVHRVELAERQDRSAAGSRRHRPQPRQPAQPGTGRAGLSSPGCKRDPEFARRS